ncbi:MAG: hypothetical protein KAI24_20970 [Planctomycetes bacterium]|nr:hypothetical protein [Planctomycetota bacterium]
MPVTRPALLTALCLLPACGPGSVATDRSGALHVAAVCAPESLEAAVREQQQATLVVALDGDEPLAKVAAAGRAQRPFVVAIGPAPQADTELPDALIADATGADVAVDLALLACNGVAPRNVGYQVGTRVWTEANRKAGGQPVLAPADPVVAMLRRQRAALLTTTPATDEAHRVALVVTDRDVAWQLAAERQARAAAARYPQLELVAAPTAAEAVANGARAILLATSDPHVTVAARAAADKAEGDPPPVIVLDPLLADGHGTCRVGCSPRTLAAAVVAQVQALLPEGGHLVLCAGAGATAAMRADAFAKALGIDPAALR